MNEPIDFFKVKKQYFRAQDVSCIEGDEDNYGAKSCIVVLRSGYRVKVGVSADEFMVHLFDALNSREEIES